MSIETCAARLAARPARRLVRLSPADLSPEQRLIHLALRREARRPTLRLSYGGLVGLLFVASAFGLVVGWGLR